MEGQKVKDEKKEKDEVKVTLYEDTYDSVKTMDDFEVLSPEHSAEIYRNYFSYEKNNSDNAVGKMYNSLTKQSQFVINNMISYFMPKKNKYSFVCHFYKKLKKYYNVTDYKVAQIIFSKMNCQQSKYFCDDANASEENIKKMLERIGNKDTITTNNERCLTIFCEALSIDKNVLFSGQGYKIELDEKEIDRLLEERSINPEDFAQKVFKRKCRFCPQKDSCYNEYKELYSKFLYYDKMELAKNMAELLNVSTSQIIIKTPLTLIIEEELFIDRYKKLSFINREIIYELMKNLYYIQYADFVDSKR